MKDLIMSNLKNRLNQHIYKRNNRFLKKILINMNRVCWKFKVKAIQTKGIEINKN